MLAIDIVHIILLANLECHRHIIVKAYFIQMHLLYFASIELKLSEIDLLI